MPRGKKAKKEEAPKAPHAIVELANGRAVSGHIVSSDDGFTAFIGDDGVSGQINESFIVAIWYKEATAPDQETKQ